MFISKVWLWNWPSVFLFIEIHRKNVEQPKINLVFKSSSSGTAEPMQWAKYHDVFSWSYFENIYDSAVIGNLFMASWYFGWRHYTRSSIVYRSTWNWNHNTKVMNMVITRHVQRMYECKNTHLIIWNIWHTCWRLCKNTRESRRWKGKGSLIQSVPYETESIYPGYLHHVKKDQIWTRTL